MLFNFLLYLYSQSHNFFKSLESIPPYYQNKTFNSPWRLKNNQPVFRRYNKFPGKLIGPDRKLLVGEEVEINFLRLIHAIWIEGRIDQFQVTILGTISQQRALNDLFATDYKHILFVHVSYSKHSSNCIFFFRILDPKIRTYDEVWCYLLIAIQYKA